MFWPPFATTPIGDRRVGGSLHKKSGDMGFLELLALWGVSAESMVRGTYPPPHGEHGFSFSNIK